jgi:transcriptional regulator with XRE-family HTH domain
MRSLRDLSMRSKTDQLEAGLITIEQIRAARGLLGWSQTELASRAGLSAPTVKRLEGGFGPKVSDASCAKLQGALEAAGIKFIEGDDGDGVLKVSKRTPGKSIRKVRKISIRQIKAARALLAWSQEKLAAAANMSIPTIKRLEAHDGPLRGRTDTGDRIEAALEKAGIEFIDENGGGPGVRLRNSALPRANE